VDLQANPKSISHQPKHNSRVADTVALVVPHPTRSLSLERHGALGMVRVWKQSLLI
jgi:hypothetical protein